MLIEIDLEEAKKLQITINQFVLLKFITDGENIKPYQSVIHVLENDILSLIEKGILEKESSFDPKDITKLKLTNDFLDKFREKDPFDEFYELYPASVVRGDGVKDYLRGDLNRCRKAYNLIVGKSRSKHSFILEALKFELSNRRLNNSMKYMKRMAKWISAEEWTLYDEFLADKKVKKQIEQVYGTNVE